MTDGSDYVVAVSLRHGIAPRVRLWRGRPATVEALPEMLAPVYGQVHAGQLTGARLTTEGLLLPLHFHPDDRRHEWEDQRSARRDFP